MFFYGVSYYPEHKEQSELAHDMKLLKESGINTVRMGEFAWCRMEPSEGTYEFDWLLDAVNELGEAGINSIICTPTACPPSFIVEKHPDILYVDNRGITRPFGGRRHYCYNNETYRNYSVRITEELVKVFGDNPYVVGFQIDNEPAQEGTGRCHCNVCTEKFRKWLKVKYGTIEELNRRYGTIFWSMEYSSFDQITPPVNSIEVGTEQQIRAFYENPSLRLDYERFCSDSQIEYQNLQTDMLRKHTSYPITTNATGLATNSIDYYKSTKELSNYAFDYYPGLRDSYVDSFPYAFARGVKDGEPFWILEFMSGGGHRLSGSGRLQPNPGALKQAVLQSFAHGASMMLHFQFRSFKIGAEQLNYAIVDMDGVPRRRYKEMQDTAALLKKLAPLEETGFRNDIAICFDYDTHWALRIKPINDPKYHYIDYTGKLYRIIQEAGYNLDVISYEADLSKYKVIVLPSAFVLSRELQEKFRKYVSNGGTLIATFLTSVKNEDNVGYGDVLPAGLTDVFGVTVEEVEPVFDDNHTKLTLSLDKDIECVDGMWSELLGGDSQALGTYIEDYKTSSKVISKHEYGDGKGYYIGTDLEEVAMSKLLGHVMKDAGVVKNLITAPSKVEVIKRVLKDKEYYFVFNFTSKNAEIMLDVPMEDYLDKVVHNNSASIERNGFMILSVSDIARTNI